MMVRQGFQPSPHEDGDYQHHLDRVAASHSPLSIPASANDPETPISDRWQGGLDPTGRHNAPAQLEAASEDGPSTL